MLVDGGDEPTTTPTPVALLRLIEPQARLSSGAWGSLFSG
jgi:hypothetical protein